MAKEEGVGRVAMRASSMGGVVRIRFILHFVSWIIYGNLLRPFHLLHFDTSASTT